MARSTMAATSRGSGKWSLGSAKGAGMCAVRELNPQLADYSQSRLTLTTMGQS